MHVTCSAVGCANLPPMEHTLIERVDRGSTVVSCVNAQDRWHLVCRDKTWIGDLHNCSNGKATIGHVTSRFKLYTYISA